MNSRVPLADFNARSADEAEAVLAPLLACAQWQRVLVAGRPYRSRRELGATSDGVVLALGWPDVVAALSDDPGAVPPAVRDTAESAAYAERFGVPFVLEATGRTAEQIWAALAERHGAEREEEQQTVRRELAAIVRNRLVKTFA